MNQWSWWRHQMETFSAVLAICAGNSPVSSEFPAQRPVTRSFEVFFDLRLIKRLGWVNTHGAGHLWRHCNVKHSIEALEIKIQEILIKTENILSKKTYFEMSHVVLGRFLRKKCIFNNNNSEAPRVYGLCFTSLCDLSYKALPVVCTGVNKSSLGVISWDPSHKNCISSPVYHITQTPETVCQRNGTVKSMI